MRKKLGMTSVAIASLMLAVAPSAAVSLSIGGGSGGGLLSGGNSGDSSGINVSTGGGSGLLDLGGSNGTDADIDLNLGGNGGALNNNVIDLNGDGDAAVELELFGRPGTPVPNNTATVNLGGDDDYDVILDLFGRSGSSDTASVQFGTGGVGDANDVMIDLFGGGDIDDSETGSITPAGSGNGGDDNAVTPGGAGTTPVGTRPQPLRPTGAAGVRVATTVATGSCFAPDAGQIGNLIARTDYSVEMTMEWRKADDVKLVPINLCANVRADLNAALSADDNIGFLHAAVAADPHISAALDPAYGPDNVLAVDQSGDDLTVYVY